MTLKKTIGYDAGGTFAEVYTDDDDGSGYGDHPRVGRWYGTRAECEALDPRMVKLYSARGEERPDEFDIACERRWD